jgi:ATP synthase protein I
MPGDGPTPKPSGALRQLSLAMELPFTLIGSVIVGGGIGYLLDRWLHTSPALALILGALGFAGGVWEIIKRLTREEKRDRENGQG